MSDSEKSFPPELADALADQITVPRILVTVGGGLLPAAWLSQALIWTNESDDSEGWFEASSPDWERDAGLNRAELQSAQNKLLHRKLIGVTTFENDLLYRVNVDAVTRAIERIQEREEAKQYSGLPDLSNVLV